MTSTDATSPGQQPAPAPANEPAVGPHSPPRTGATPEAAAGSLAPVDAARPPAFADLAVALDHVAAHGATADAVVATILDHGILVTGAYAGGLAALVDDGRAFDVLGTVGYTPGVLREVLRIPRGAALPICDVADHGRPIYLGSLAAWRARYAVDPLALGRRADGAWAALPLASEDGTCFGVLTLSFLEPRSFPPAEQQLLERLADQCAAALAPFLQRPAASTVAAHELADDASCGEPPATRSVRPPEELSAAVRDLDGTSSGDTSVERERPGESGRDSHDVTTKPIAEHPPLRISARPSAAEAEVRAALERMPQLVWTTTPDGYHDYYNARWYAYTGMPRPDDPAASAEGWNWKHYLHPDDFDRAVARWAHSLATGEPYEIEYRFREGSTGRYRWFLGRAEPHRDAEGRIVRWFGTCTDIDDATQLRQAVETANAQLRAQTSAIEAQAGLLADQAARLEAKAREAEVARSATERILSAVADGVLGLDADGRVTFANAAAVRLLGYDPTEVTLIGQPFDARFHRHDDLHTHQADRSADRQHAHHHALRQDRDGVCPIARALTTGQPVRVPHDVFVQQGGARLPVRYAVHPIVERARVTGAVLTFADLTAQLAAEVDRLRLAGDASRARERADLAEARLVQVFRQAPAFIAVLHGREHRFAFVNERYAALVGHRDVIGRSVREALPEVAGQGFFEILDRVLATGESFVGTEMPIHLQAAPVELTGHVPADGKRIGADLPDSARLDRDRQAAGPAPSTLPVDAPHRPGGTLTESDGGRPDTAEDERTGDGHPTRAEIAEAEGGAVDPAVAPVELRYLTFIYQALVDADGTRSGVFVHGVDVTEQVRARHLAEAERARAEAAREAAHRANLAKAQFLATMSHELRTPLNAISGYVQLMSMGLHGPISDGQQDALGRIDRAQRHLLGIINDILNYAKLEAGRVVFDLQPTAPAELMQAVQPLVAPQLHAKALRYVVDVPFDDPTRAGVPLLAWADREKLIQVLLNLLSNAVKFTPVGGEIRVTLDIGDGPERAPSIRGGSTTARKGDDRAIASAESGQAEAAASRHDLVASAPASDEVTPATLVPTTGRWLRLHVQDTGPGIAADKLGSIFAPFEQAHSERSTFTRAFEGTGLGLAISRDLARGMGGELSVDSALGEGATFTLWLPQVEPSATGSN